MSRVFLLAHLTDPHIGADWGGGDPEACLAAAVDAALAVRPRPDAVLVTGDLALIPERHRDKAQRTLIRMMDQMTAWARGVAINGVITGASTGILLWAVGVQPAFVFGVLAFFGEFLPNIPKLISGIDANLPVEDLRTLPQQVRENVFLDRFISVMSTASCVPFNFTSNPVTRASGKPRSM